MAYEFNIRVIIKIKLKKILKSIILFIFYINSKSLYNCLIKLNIIYKKELIINIISLYKLDKQYKIIKIK